MTTALQPATAPNWNPQITLCPEEQAFSHACWERVWQVASLSILVAFTALAVVGLVLSSIYVPIYIPIISILAMQLAPYAFSGYAYLQGYAQTNGVKAAEATLIGKELEALPTTSEEIQKKLKDELGVQPNLVDYTPLRSALARYNYMVGQTAAMQNKQQETAQSLDALKSAEKPNIVDIQNSQLEILQFRQNIALNRIQTAYLRGILARPEESRTQNELFESFYAPWQSRLLVQHNEIEENENQDLYDAVLSRVDADNPKKRWFLKIRGVERWSTAQITDFIFSETKDLPNLIQSFNQRAQSILNAPTDQDAAAS